VGKVVVRRILIIEDEIPIKELYERVFAKRGWKVVGVVTGAQAFEKAGGQKFEMILLDIMLPEKNGVDVLRDIKAPNSSWRQTPVFMLTNLGQESVIREAFKLGAEGYLLKAQLLPDQIVTEVETFLAKNKSP